MTNVRMGPLAGMRIIEFAGLGPAPMGAMLLADLGASVIRIDRPAPSALGVPRAARVDILRRGRRSICLDLKAPSAVALIKAMLPVTDALIEGFRPGVMERLGLGPLPCLDVQPRLVYARMTGWGQSGPLAQSAGHDLNYIALTGALDAIGRAGQPPTPPLSLLGDFAGGSLYLVLGILAAIWESGRSGHGQVVDAAVIDGAASLSAVLYAMTAAGQMTAPRGGNLLDSGAYFYESYRCSDGKYVCVAAIESKFHAELLERLGIDRSEIPDQMDRKDWPRIKALFAKRFAEKTREEWCALLEGTDACFAPVLSVHEAPSHRHVRERETLIEVDGVLQPAPAPRFSRTSPATPGPADEPGVSDPIDVLAEWGAPGEAMRCAESIFADRRAD